MITNHLNSDQESADSRSNQHRKTTDGVRRNARKFKPRNEDLFLFDDEEDEFDDIGDLEDCLEEVDETPRKRLDSLQNTFQEKAQTCLVNCFPREDERGPHVCRWQLRLTQDATDACLLAQLIYWVQPGKGHAPDLDKSLPCVWTAKTSEELARELALSKHVIDRSLKRLQKSRFIDWKVRKFGGLNHRFIWINWTKIEARYKVLQKKEDGDESHE